MKSKSIFWGGTLESMSIMMHMRFSLLVRYSLRVRSHEARSFLDTLA